MIDPASRDHQRRRPRSLVVSHVLPFPGASGQQQRVAYKLRALRRHFHVTFLTFAAPGRAEAVRAELLNFVDATVVLPSACVGSRSQELLHRMAGLVYCLRTGLKPSNYRIGEVELSPDRVLKAVELDRVDCVIFEYWHAYKAAEFLRSRGVPTVLDTHNVLWQAYKQQLQAKSHLPRWLNTWALGRYKAAEERAWRSFDALITINAAEDSYVRERMPENVEVIYTPMGIDLEDWSYSWRFGAPPRVAYYGGLGSRRNQRDALSVYADVMPRVWERHPEAELWFVGSRPPDALREISRQDPRVTVTGFVERVQESLAHVTVLVCPWEGTYGFRSRLVEVMALGVPVVTMPEAVFGMEFAHERGVLLADDLDGLAAQTLRLLGDTSFAREQSRRAREEVERLFSMESTYGTLADQLLRLSGT